MSSAWKRTTGGMVRPRAVAVVGGIFLLGWAGSAAAHGFGQHYDLPVPLWLYVVGAAATVAVSFVVVGICVRGTSGSDTYPRINLLQLPVWRFVAHPVCLFCLKLVSAGLLLLIFLAGLFGHQNPAKNLVPTLVWIIWWVGLAYVSALAGNLWALMNPWKGLFGWAEVLYRRVAPGRELSRHWAYPPTLGAWPGVLLFLGFAWIELVFQGAVVPANLAVMALVYSGITWTGMFLFGKDTWLRYGEAFSLAFSLLARFAPTEVRVRDPRLCQTCGLACQDRDGACIDCYACFARAEAARREWNLRPYAIGLVRNHSVSVSEMVFVLLLLATVTFDGFLATPVWTEIRTALLGLLPDLGEAGRLVTRTLGLLAFPLLFLEIYLIFSILMAVVSGRRLAGVMLARTFIFTLVPIAIAYHIAHYLSFLLVQGQRLLPLASDPFGFGWNLLGTAEYGINIGLVGAQFGWYTMVLAIVAGHIIAVYLAHLVAVRTLHQRAIALRSQYPMLVLMVGYTMLSLWILAQPIVESDEGEDTSTTAQSRGTCQGFVVLPNGSAVLSGLSAAVHRAHARGETTSIGSADRLLGYQHGQAISLKQGMFCVPIRDSQTTAWFAISWDAGLSVTINSLKGLLSSGHGDHAAFAITLWDNHRGAAVEGASIRLFARMPHHDRDTPGGHGLANDPDMRGLTAIPSSPGHYTAEPIHFAMPGAWLVEIQIQQEGKAQRAYFATMVDE
jgi:hypothetical protein